MKCKSAGVSSECKTGYELKDDQCEEESSDEDDPFYIKYFYYLLAAAIFLLLAILALAVICFCRKRKV